MTWFDPRVWLVVNAAVVVSLAGGYFKGRAERRAHDHRCSPGGADRRDQRCTR